MPILTPVTNLMNWRRFGSFHSVDYERLCIQAYKCDREYEIIREERVMVKSEVIIPGFASSTEEKHEKCW
jgi:hypothetical protein